MGAQDNWGTGGSQGASEQARRGPNRDLGNLENTVWLRLVAECGFFDEGPKGHTWPDLD